MVEFLINICIIAFALFLIYKIGEKDIFNLSHKKTSSHDKPMTKNNTSSNSTYLPKNTSISQTNNYYKVKTTITTETNTNQDDTDDYPPLLVPDISDKPRYHQFKVKGKNPITNRMKTRIVVALENTSDEEITKKANLEEPFTITIDSEANTERPATEAQINFAKNINIPIPNNCSCSDLSCLLSKQLGEMTNNLITNGLLDFAAENNICISPYCSIESGIYIVFHDLKRSPYSFSLFAYFSYFIFCIHSNTLVENLNQSNYKDVFYKFASLYSNDEQLHKYIKEFDVYYFIEKKRVDGRKKKICELYKVTYQFLCENIEIFQID